MLKYANIYACLPCVRQQKSWKQLLKRGVGGSINHYPNVVLHSSRKEWGIFICNMEKCPRFIIKETNLSFKIIWIAYIYYFTNNKNNNDNVCISIGKIFGYVHPKLLTVVVSGEWDYPQLFTFSFIDICNIWVL